MPPGSSKLVSHVPKRLADDIFVKPCFFAGFESAFEIDHCRLKICAGRSVGFAKKNAGICRLPAADLSAPVVTSSRVHRPTPFGFQVGTGGWSRTNEGQLMRLAGIPFSPM